MDPVIAVIALGVGYLAGSISFARIVAGIVRPGEDVTRVEAVVGDGNAFTFTSASATSVRVKVGRRWGILTGLLDMLKIAIPVLAFSLAFPGEPYRLLVAFGGLIGHDWPVWYRFHGGRGETVIYAALFVIDPIGTLLIIPVGIAIGFLTGSILGVRWAGMLLMVPWLLLVRDDPGAALWMAVSIAIYGFSLRFELRQFVAMMRGPNPPTNEVISRDLGMGGGLGRAVDRWSIPALVARMRARGEA